MDNLRKELPINTTIEGNALEVLKSFPDEYFFCCITSPPYYGLRSYKTEPQIWDGDQLDCDHEWTTEITKTIQPQPDSSGGVATGKTGTRGKQSFNAGTSGELSQGMFCIKCHAWRGELGLEPTPELYQAHLLDIFTEVKRVVRNDGTIFVNIGDSYAGGGRGGQSESKRSKNWKPEYGFALKNKIYTNVKAKSLMQIPSRFSIAMTDKLGLLLRNNIIWYKPGVMPSSSKDRFTLDYEDVYFYSKNKTYYFEQQLEPADYDGRKDTKFKGSVKYNNPEIAPDGAINTFAKQGHERWLEVNGVKMRNMRTVWKIPAESLREEHYATFPQRLVERIIKAGCPEQVCSKCSKPVLKTYEGKSNNAFNIRVRDVKKGRIKHSDRTASEEEVKNYDEKNYGGEKTEKIIKCNCNAEFVAGVILDPFIGSGTTGIVARKLNRDYIGIDLKYFQINEDRHHKELGFFR